MLQDRLAFISHTPRRLINTKKHCQITYTHKPRLAEKRKDTHEHRARVGKYNCGLPISAYRDHTVLTVFGAVSVADPHVIVRFL